MSTVAAVIDRLKRESPEDWFWDKVIKDPMSGCWLWTAYVDPQGYGRISIDKTSHLAHRVSWQLHIGSIPNHLCVLHRCDIPSCVNPDHLFLGDRRTNSLDASRKGRMARGERQGCAKLTEDDVRSIRTLIADDDQTQRQIGSAFGVHQVAISHIKLGKTWSWLS